MLCSGGAGGVDTEAEDACLGGGGRVIVFPAGRLTDCRVDARVLYPVSYTHLDVYKRQGSDSPPGCHSTPRRRFAALHRGGFARCGGLSARTSMNCCCYGFRREKKEKVPWMKHIFIINPAAGKYDRTEEFSGKIAASCASRGLDYACLLYTSPVLFQIQFSH